ncbi:MAG TPA: DUF4395 domain-containing protein [Solirubrobacterales bacterium]|nr:DUF4395 domain-containing protein [Solirubrobacterales bacterium]
MFGFPNPVNEKAARSVAACVALVSLLGLISGWQWLLIPLSIGFWLRVLAGPRLSPFGLLATKVIAPRVGPEKLVPGPPKRFAQAIGGTVTAAGTLLVFAFGVDAAAPAVFAIMLTFAALESVFGLCVGCKMFAILMRLGVIPEEICEACADISLRRA